MDKASDNVAVVRTGMELVFTLQLALEIMDEYKLNGLLKKHGNMFKRTLESNVGKAYDRVFSLDQEMAINAMNLKQRMISQIASLPEPEAIVFSEYVNNFFENKEKAISRTLQALLQWLTKFY